MAELADLAEELRARRPAEGCFIVGLTGPVAVGKSTLAAALKRVVEAWPGSPRVEVACTDGFLFSNAALEAAGLTSRKGFPETYDAVAMAGVLAGIRGGAATFPGYSHLTYDIDPGLARRLETPDVLILEGLGLAGAAVDVLVFLEASEADLEAWFTARFLELWRAGQADETAFYARFAHLDREGALSVAAWVWREINLPNIRAHIAPLRHRAEVVVAKGRDHSVETILWRLADGDRRTAGSDDRASR